jgi:hypothetical protein
VRCWCLRALAVPLERASASPRTRRRWYRPARAPIPPEPGRLVVSALLGRVRRSRGCSTPGDDRLETRAYAVKRYLFRLGHAARSGRFACSLEQLVAGLAPVMGWGRIPRGGADRVRFVRAHRRSVQRWLDDLEAAGLVAHQPERDEHGAWWRTQIVLQAAPVPTAEELGLARARARGWRGRERRRRRRARRAPSLGAILSRSSVPQARVRARLARGRAVVAHEARRRAWVEAELARVRARQGSLGVLTHPFGAPPTSAQPPGAPRRRRRSPAHEARVQARSRSAQTLVSAPTFVAGTGAHARAAAVPPPPVTPARRKECSEAIGSGPPDRFDALVRRRVAARRAQLAGLIALRREHAASRVDAVVAWSVGQACPVGRLREAWVAYRHGLSAVAESGSVAAGARSDAVARRARDAIRLYEEFAVQRPPGWPASGAAALCALASQRHAAVFAGDVARLLVLAKGMRAAALERDAERVARAAIRAQRRRAATPGPVAFRLPTVRWETAELRRRRVRDALLHAGDDPAAWPNSELAERHHPQLRRQFAARPALVGTESFSELDGVAARARRYRAELASGRWRLDAGWRSSMSTPDPQEVQTP